MKPRAQLAHALDVHDALLERHDIGTRRGKADFDREWAAHKQRLGVTEEDMNGFLYDRSGPDLPLQRPVNLDSSAES